MDKTLQYYNENAATFTTGTINVDFEKLQNEFCSRIRYGGHILDLGCGSGRDSKMFLTNGFRVTAVDGSEALAKLASEYIGQEVIVSTFQDYEPDQTFDGIWACASLLHLPPAQIEEVMRKLAGALADDGCFYASFKYGSYAGERNGRYFTDMNVAEMTALIDRIPELEIAKMFVTGDARQGREDEMWLNVILSKV